MSEKIMGFRRPDGSVGVRNHVVILPVDDISNAAVEHVSEVIEDTLPLPHPYGRLQFGEDFDLFFRTIIGTGCNPNVAAVVVIGIEPNWTEKVVEGIAKTGKPVAGFSIERTGDLGTIEKAARKAKEFVHLASEMQREPVDVGELTISIKCGESDTTSGLASNPTVGKAVERMVQREGGTVMFGETSELTGGEQFVAERMKTEELKQEFMDVFNSYNEFIESKGVSLLGSQPTQGNIRGGLTTIEEKAMGNIQTIGNCQVDGVLAPAEAPDGKGLYFMDTSSAAAEAVTLFAAAGSVLHFFPTGQGNIVGHPVIPVVKLSANPLTVETMSEHIDLDVSKLLSLDMDLDEAGDALWSIMKRTLNGRKTAAEVLGHKEFVLTKLYRSA
jgi:(2R)-sulfolactate sulfo-lyase subunit beta